jgi:hypothetical protein
MVDVPQQIKEYEEDKAKGFVDFGNNLFSDLQLKRNTFVLPEESAILAVLFSLGRIQDNFRIKYLGDLDERWKQKCNLTIIMEDNLGLRSSIKGWRSEQTKNILEAGKIEQTINQPQNPMGSVMGRGRI